MTYSTTVNLILRRVFISTPFFISPMQHTYSLQHSHLPTFQKEKSRHPLPSPFSHPILRLDPQPRRFCRHSTNS